MDSLSYSYNYLSSGMLAGKLSNNRLRRVRDFMSNAAAYDESDVATGVSDLEDQTNADNYTYDEIGNLKSDTKENISLINWNVYGKITDINFNFIANKNKTIYYLYDAAGNRIGKQVEKYGATSGATTTSTYTWYVRDASGNVMATYNSSGTAATIPVTLSLGERHLYGSSRLGLLGLTADSKNLPQSAPTSVYSSNFIRGNKFFELSNHLGNVLVTVSDKKIGVDDGTYDAGGVKLNSTLDDKIDFYTADVVTANDYYPFGMGMPGRKFAANNKYRYGFNGKEQSQEVNGAGNLINYRFRTYDPRIGRFISTDPLECKYPAISPYVFCENQIIACKDLEGLEAAYIFGTAEYMAAIFGHEVSIGLAVDSKGIAFGGSLGGKFGIGISASAAIGLTVIPDMDDLQNMSGKGEAFNVSGAFLGKFSLGVAKSSGKIGGVLTVGIGVGFQVSYSQSHTWLSRTYTWEELSKMAGNSNINGVNLSALLEAYGLNNNTTASNIKNTFLGLYKPFIIEAMGKSIEEKKKNGDALQRSIEDNNTELKILDKIKKPSVLQNVRKLILKISNDTMQGEIEQNENEIKKLNDKKNELEKIPDVNN